MPLMRGKSDRAFDNNVSAEMDSGKPLKQSLAIAYAMKRKAGGKDPGYAYGGSVDDDRCVDCEMGQCSQHPSEDYDYEEPTESDVVGRIMEDMGVQKMSLGGRVANQEHGPEDSRLAGFSRNEFDDLVLRDDLEFSYTGANSGDEIGCEGEDDRRRDIVSEIMRTLAKKDRMPISGYGVSYGKYT